MAHRNRWCIGLPIKNGDFPQFFVNVYQRVYLYRKWVDWVDVKSIQLCPMKSSSFEPHLFRSRGPWHLDIAQD